MGSTQKSQKEGEMLRIIVMAVLCIDLFWRMSRWMQLTEMVLLAGLFLVSIPLHELGHLLCFCALGNKREDFEVRWFGFPTAGVKFVNPDGLKVPEVFRNHLNLVPFLVGLSGGLGAGILLHLGYLLTPIISAIEIPLGWIIFAQLIYSVGEGISVMLKTDVVEVEKCLSRSSG